MTPKFSISCLIYILSVIIRLCYIIYYPVQPRDVFVYAEPDYDMFESTINIAQINFPYLSLFILGIGKKILFLDFIQSGIIVNIILGSFMIVVVYMTISHFIQKNNIAFFLSIVLSSHPRLIRMAGCALRETSYLFFFFHIVNQEINT